MVTLSAFIRAPQGSSSVVKITGMAVGRIGSTIV
jgi:hypothetical protein